MVIYQFLSIFLCLISQSFLARFPISGRYASSVAFAECKDFVEIGLGQIRNVPAGKRYNEEEMIFVSICEEIDWDTC